jgi:hypothetical protein
VSEYPKPWHNLDPADWPSAERRIHKVISSVETGKLRMPKKVLESLRMQLPTPYQESKFEQDIPPYRTPETGASTRIERRTVEEAGTSNLSDRSIRFVPKSNLRELRERKSSISEEAKEIEWVLFPDLHRS